MSLANAVKQAQRLVKRLLVSRAMRVNDANGNPRAFCESQHFNADDVTCVVIENVEFVLAEKTTPEKTVAEVVVSVMRSSPYFAVDFHYGERENHSISFLIERFRQMINVCFDSPFMIAIADHKNLFNSVFLHFYRKIIELRI